MSNEREPTLKDLGLDAPAKVSNKISIDRLQRESEIETAQSRPVVAPSIQSRSLAMDVGALLLSIFLPGAGHVLKGHWGTGIVWFIAVLLGYVFFFWPGIVLQIFCIVDSVRTLPAK